MIHHFAIAVRKMAMHLVPDGYSAIHHFLQTWRRVVARKFLLLVLRSAYLFLAGSYLFSCQPVFYFLLQCHQCMQQCFWSWRTACNVNINRNYMICTFHNRICIVKKKGRHLLRMRPLRSHISDQPSDRTIFLKQEPFY